MLAKQFSDYLTQTKEVGFAQQVMPSLVYCSGLPRAKASELVLFETGEVGTVLALKEDVVEVLMLSSGMVKIGVKAARSDEVIQIGVGTSLLGHIISPLGRVLLEQPVAFSGLEYRPVDSPAPGIDVRRDIDTVFETGVSMVDLVIPLGKGQRELIIGDRKTGKSQLLKQSMVSHVRRGGICVYAAIAKRQTEILEFKTLMEKEGLKDKAVFVVTNSADAAGLVYITPYTAMTIAEYFRDQGNDVLLILDDLTIHAKYYREITLSAKRFPGRSAYPGDIFYIHSRLLERAGNFQKGSITCLPVAETVVGDISGYIQTNLMSMTDGHIFFDSEMYNQGRRPAINPFLSVTRVGHQAQTAVFKDIGRVLSSFMVKYQKLLQLMHFGGELTDTVKQQVALGERVNAVFDQGQGASISPANMDGVIVAALWAGYWEGVSVADFKEIATRLRQTYFDHQEVREAVDRMISQAMSFEQLQLMVKQNQQFFMSVGVVKA